MSELDKPILEMTAIKKSFNNVPVLQKVGLTLYPGEIVGLLGENGAGKSTLIKILCGVYAKDAGEIKINGTPVEIPNVEAAQELGIRTIYQELSLFSTLSVAENIFIHNEIAYRDSKWMIAPLASKEMEAQAKSVLNDKLGVQIDPTLRIEEISMAQRQLTEIARAVYSNARIIIMDEPTTTLETKEKEQLFQVMHELREKGTSIIFISHYLDEVMEICDRVVVLRDGKNELCSKTADIQKDDLIQAMIGKSVANQYPKKHFELGNPLLELKNLGCGQRFQGVSFTLHEKEIIGIVGLEGCGKNDIIRSLFGIHPADNGEILLKGNPIRIRSIQDAIHKKIALLPGERKTEGIFAQLSVLWNLTIANLGQVIRHGLIQSRKEQEIVQEYIDRFLIKTDSQNQQIDRLSGGNQQKTLLGRWILTDPDILLLEEPTRGIDVNAKSEVYRLIGEYVGQGKGVIMVSSEEEEVRSICDKVIVVHKGKIQAVLNAAETNIEEIKYYSMNNLEKSNEVKVYE